MADRDFRAGAGRDRTRGDPVRPRHSQEEQDRYRHPRAPNDARRHPAPASADPDPALDFCADSFDPVKALAAPRVTLPSPAVRPLDNLHRCYTVMIMSKDERDENTRRVAAKAAEAARKRQLEEMHAFHPKNLAEKARKALVLAGEAATEEAVAAAAEQAKKDAMRAVKAPKNRVKHGANVLEMMKGGAEQKGPLSVVGRSFLEHRRVAVVVRGPSRDIRGKCVGFIVAYDRHLNLVLLDVTETFAAVTHVSRADLAAAAPNEYAGKWPGRPRARRLYCVSQTQTRHLSQLLIRGDAVVSVAMLTPARGTETDPAVPPRGTTPPAAAVSAPPAVPLEPASKPPAAPIAPPAFSWTGQFQLKSLSAVLTLSALAPGVGHALAEALLESNAATIVVNKRLPLTPDVVARLAAEPGAVLLVAKTGLAAAEAPAPLLRYLTQQGVGAAALAPHGTINILPVCPATAALAVKGRAADAFVLLTPPII